MFGPVLYPKAGVWVLQGKEDRRVKRAQRIVWYRDDQALGNLTVQERRVDADTKRVLAQLASMVEKREVVGMVSAVIRPDGSLELIGSGLPYDIPMMGSGAAARLHAFFEDWIFHPDRYFRKEIGAYGARLDAIFKKVLEAYELLSDPATRAEVQKAEVMNANAGAGAESAGAPDRPS